MTKEHIKHQEEEKKRKKLTEKQLKEEHEKQIKFVKKKEKIEINSQTDSALSKLKELINKGVITESQAKKIINKESLNTEEIKTIFEKIKQIEDIKDITKYIPKELVIKASEYSNALTDKNIRTQVITKCEKSLQLIATKIKGHGPSGLSLFSSFLHILDENLIIIQENTIDIKESLIKVDKI